MTDSSCCVMCKSYTRTDEGCTSADVLSLPASGFPTEVVCSPLVFAFEFGIELGFLLLLSACM